MKLTKFVPRSITIELDDQAKDLTLDFAAIRKINEQVNAIDEACYVYRIADGSERADPIRLSTFFTVLCNLAGVTLDGEELQAEDVYNSIMQNIDLLSGIVDVCFQAALAIVPLDENEQLGEVKKATKKPQVRAKKTTTKKQAAG